MARSTSPESRSCRQQHGAVRPNSKCTGIRLGQNPARLLNSSPSLSPVSLSTGGGNLSWRSADLNGMLRQHLADRAPDMGRLLQSQQGGDVAGEEAGVRNASSNPSISQMRKHKPGPEKLMYKSTTHSSVSGLWSRAIEGFR